MGKIWTTSQDSTKYAAVADLVGINKTAAEIDASPLFTSAEDYIIGIYPKAIDRTDANRSVVDTALQYGAAANILQGGGELTGGTTDAGAVKSVTIDDVRTEYATSTTTQAGESSTDKRVAFFIAQRDALLAQITDASSPDDIPIFFGKL